MEFFEKSKFLKVSLYGEQHTAPVYLYTCISFLFLLEINHFCQIFFGKFEFFYLKSFFAEKSKKKNLLSQNTHQ